MYVGLNSGYCRFGTLAHQILLLTLEHGKVSSVWLAEHFTELKDAKQAISANLRRLTDNRFLYKIGTGREPGGRIYEIYGLNPPVRGPRLYPMTSAERCRAYRARKSKVVSSVFEWRGS